MHNIEKLSESTNSLPKSRYLAEGSWQSYQPDQTYKSRYPDKDYTNLILENSLAIGNKKTSDSDYHLRVQRKGRVEINT